MNLRCIFRGLATTAVLASGLLVGFTADAQDPFVDDNQPSLFESLEPTASTSPSDVKQSKMTVQELRQARALYRANQRVARLEYNLWMGIEPLRPRWNPLPMMSSRYQRPKIHVPVYIFP